MSSPPKLAPNQMVANDANTNLDHMSALNIYSEPKMGRLTGIICTIGPASREVPKLVELIKAGMGIARLNFSHGTHEYHLETLNNIRAAVEKASQDIGIANYSVAIALDTKGPEIRTGLLAGGPSAEVELIKGKTTKLTTDDSFIDKGSAEVIHLDYKNIVKVVKVDSRVYIDDGLISLMVKEVGPDFLICLIENGGKLGSKKGVNLPGALVDLPAVSERDKKDLQFGITNKVDMIFASFIRNGSGVKEIRDILNAGGGQHIKIISKVENHEGVQKIDEIIAASDGLMVARGDMGIEIPPEKVFLAQKMIISKCNVIGKPVICATQMLESMTTKPRPTRAEVSDVSNAVMEGADCVMLSGESAKGDYPVQAVQMMSQICLEADSAFHTKTFFLELCGKTQRPSGTLTALCMATVAASFVLPAKVIVILTTTGVAAHVISQYRPRCPIIVVCRKQLVARQCRLYRAIHPLFNETNDVKQGYNFAIDYAKKFGIAKSGDQVLLVTTESGDLTHSLTFHAI